MFDKRIAVVTGGASGIGKVIAQQFQAAGARVCIIDVLPNDYFVGDLADQAVLEAFARKVIDQYGRVDYLVHNAKPLTRGIQDCSYDEFNYALRVGITAPFYLTKLFAPYFPPGGAVVNISSSRDRMSQPQTESYTAAKGGIHALTHALARESGRKGPGQLHLPRLDRHRRYPLHRPGRGSAARRTGGKSHGHRQHGTLPVFGQGRIHHRGEHLHRRGDDPPDDLSQRFRLDPGRVKGRKSNCGKKRKT